jgi:hypothetical protein
MAKVYTGSIWVYSGTAGFTASKEKPTEKEVEVGTKITQLELSSEEPLSGKVPLGHFVDPQIWVEMLAMCRTVKRVIKREYRFGIN